MFCHAVERRLNLVYPHINYMLGGTKTPSPQILLFGGKSLVKFWKTWFYPSVVKRRPHSTGIVYIVITIRGAGGVEIVCIVCIVVVARDRKSVV